MKCIFYRNESFQMTTMVHRDDDDDDYGYGYVDDNVYDGDRVTQFSDHSNGDYSFPLEVENLLKSLERSNPGCLAAQLSAMSIICLRVFVFCSSKVDYILYINLAGL